jgi:hypothetical protein
MTTLLLIVVFARAARTVGAPAADDRHAGQRAERDEAMFSPR